MGNSQSRPSDREELRSSKKWKSWRSRRPAPSLSSSEVASSSTINDAPADIGKQSFSMQVAVLSSSSGNLPTDTSQREDQPTLSVLAPGSPSTLVTTSTASSSSSAYETTNQNKYFFRLARLILDICNDAMRDLMRSKISDNEVMLTKRIALSQSDLDNGRLFQSQKQIIFPPNNRLVRYQTLDFSLMYLLVRNVFHEEIESDSKRNKRWGKCPTANDTSLLAAIETIREYRNKFFAHAVSSRINEKDFENLWTDIERAVDNINNHIDRSISTVCYKKEMKKLKKSSTDPDLEKILAKLFEVEKQWNELFKMEVETDLKLEELMDIRRNYGQKTSGSRYSKSKDENLGQTEAFLAKYINESKYYYETEKFKEVEEFLKQRKCVFLVGKEGSGKTEMAVHLMFKYSEYKNFVVRRVQSSYECRKFYNPLDKMFILIDDVFDSGTVADWWQTFSFLRPFIQSCTESQAFEESRKDHEAYLVFTTRAQKLEDAKNNMPFNHSLKEYTKVIDSDEALSRSEKKEILLRKLKFAEDVYKIEGQHFSEEDWEHIYNSSPPFGFPLCARLFACDKTRTYRESGKHFFSNPKKHVLSKIKGIIEDDERRHTEVLFVLILIHQIKNESFIWNDAKKSWEILCDLKFDRDLKLKEKHVRNLQQIVSYHRESFVRESEENELQFIHPSVQEAVEEYFIETYTAKAIEILPLAMLLQKMDKRHLSKLTPSDTPYNELFICRLIQEIENRNVCKTFKYQGFENFDFSKDFVNHITKDVIKLKNLLAVSDGEEDFPFIYWFTKYVRNDIVLEFLNHNTVEKACPDKELYDQHFFALVAACSSEEKLDIIENILSQYPQGDIQKDYKVKENVSSFACYLSPLLEATDSKNEDAVKTLIKHGASFPLTNWLGWPFLHACWGEDQICCSNFLSALRRFEEKKMTGNKDLICEESTDIYERIILAIETSISRKNGKLTHILFDLMVISELEVTDQLIKAFCSLESLTDFEGQMPLNYGYKKGNSILHLILKKCEDVQDDWLDDSSHEDVILDGDIYTAGNDIFEKDQESEENGNQERDDEETGSKETEDHGENFLQFGTGMWSKTKTLQTLRVLHDNNTNFNLKNKMGQTPLMIEVSKINPSVEIMALLLSCGANPNEKDNNGCTCIHLLLTCSSAREKRVYDCIIELLKHEVDLNIKDKSGHSPVFLELKRFQPRLRILSTLLAGSIDMNALDSNGRSPLDVTMQLSIDEDRRIQIMQVLLRSKTIQVHKGKDTSFQNSLSDLQNQSKLFTLLVYHESCKYPLHECIKARVDEERKIEAIEYLLSIDIEKVINEKSCKYPLHECIKARSDEDRKIEAIKHLLQKVSTSAVNEENETLLITAAQLCPDMHELFDLLLSKQIDIDAKDNAGKTALVYLLECDLFELSERKYALDRLLSKKPEVDYETENLKSLSPMVIAMQSLVNTSQLLTSDSSDVQSAVQNQQSVGKSQHENQSMFSSPIKHTFFQIQSSNLETQNISISAEIVAKILDLVKTNLNIQVDEKGRTFLHYCASSRLADKHVLPICERLVKLGVNVDEKDQDGLTCIDMAFKFSGNNVDTLLFLLENSNLQGLDVDTSLERLADCGHLNLPVVKYLLARLKPKRNLLHYLAAMKFYPKSLRPSEIEEVFNYLKDHFAVEEKNDEGKIPLHIATESNASVSCVLCFLKISSRFVNEKDCEENTAVHLVLKSERMDIDVCTIVKEMIEFKADLNEQNELGRTPLMVAVKCTEKRSVTIAEILKHKPNLSKTDRFKFTVLHYCVEESKDDLTSCSLLSLFLDSGLPVPLKMKSSEGLTPLNLAARNGKRSRILCLIKLLQRKDCMAETVDKKGHSPLHNTALGLKGEHPIVTLERLIRSFIFLVHGASPKITANDNCTVFEVCEKMNHLSLLQLFEMDTGDIEEMHDIIKQAWLDVARQLYDKNESCFENVLEWDKTTIDEQMKSLIKDALPYLSHCEFNELKHIREEEHFEYGSSVVDLEL
uniref:Uncharacterized protein LOC111103680 isoform X2 n=1 Tax=Crassostrea virginica TaxID=6565 RepID=A0A8B8AQA9_CRAVI|nr:uncharacterized protein LOC111103680 isoform X2 [Crassostrea virginica]